MNKGRVQDIASRDATHVVLAFLQAVVEQQGYSQGHDQLESEQNVKSSRKLKDRGGNLFSELIQPDHYYTDRCAALSEGPGLLLTVIASIFLSLVD